MKRFKGFGGDKKKRKREFTKKPKVEKTKVLLYDVI